jgi:DNA-binding transcriptional MerR regulator
MNRLLERLDEGKLYYSISEVCRMTGLEAHVLRYWETEFAQMRPRKNRAGNRAYRPREIQYVQYIRHLLHEEKYTLQGAKKKLAEVSFEEVAGQTMLLRVPPADKPAAGPAAGAAATPAPEAAPTGLTADQRRELESIRDGLRDVLKMLGVKG